MRCGRFEQLLLTPPLAISHSFKCGGDLEGITGRSPAAEERSDGALVCGRVRPVGRCGQCWDQAR